MSSKMNRRDLLKIGALGGRSIAVGGAGVGLKATADRLDQELTGIESPVVGERG